MSTRLAVGRRLDHKHPAYASLIENRDYTGKAHLFGRDYMTRYEPITEQAAVTKDVASNIARASEGVKTAGEQVGQTATVSASIAQEIAALSLAVSEIRAGGRQVEASATELHGLATHLGTLVERFKT